MFTNTTKRPTGRNLLLAGLTLAVVMAAAGDAFAKPGDRVCYKHPALGRVCEIVK